MNIDRTEHGGYRREVASKLGLCGNGRMTNEKPIKRAAGGSIPKLATGGALKNLGKAMRHDISHAARKTREGFKDFGRKEKEGFENIGRKIKTDVIDKSRRGFNEHVKPGLTKAGKTAANYYTLGQAYKNGPLGAKSVERGVRKTAAGVANKAKNVAHDVNKGFNEHVSSPTRKAAATAKNMAREIGHDINTKAIKPTGRYLKESARKDNPEKMAFGGFKRFGRGVKQVFNANANAFKELSKDNPFTAMGDELGRKQPSRRASQTPPPPPPQQRTPWPPKPAVVPNDQLPPNAQTAMKKGGKACKMRMGGVHGFPGPHKTPKAWKDGGHIGDLKIGSGKRVKANVQTRHNFQNVGRMLTGKEEKSVYGAKERRERKEAGLPRMAHGGVGKLRHGVTPKSGITSSKWQDKDKYM